MANTSICYMRNFKRMYLVICFLTGLLCTITRASRTNFEVKQFGVCNNTQGVIKYYGNITKENDEQYLTHEIVRPFELGSNIGVSCLIESLITETVSVELFTIKEKNICVAAKTYVGELWYDILRAEGQYNVKSCPQPAGRYRVRHLKVDFNKMSLQTFPFGTLRFTIKAIEHKHPEINTLCLFIVVQNKIN